MVDEIPDKIIPGIPPLFEEARDDVEQMRDETSSLLDSTESEHAQVQQDIAAGVLTMTQLVEQAEEARDAALGWVGEGQGVSIGPEPPDNPREGHVWLREKSVERIPLYPRKGLYPHQGLYPNRSGQIGDGSKTIDAIRRYRSVDEAWDDYRLDPALMQTTTINMKEE